jgi:hypothetical protein
MEAVDLGVMWKHLNCEIKGLGRIILQVTWHANVTQDDVEPHLTCHVSPRFRLFIDPMCPIEHATCHPL